MATAVASETVRVAPGRGRMAESSEALIGDPDQADWWGAARGIVRSAARLLCMTSVDERDRGQPINSPRAPEPVGAYPHARRAGNLLFLSGVGPRRRGSSEIPGVVLGRDGSVIEHDI